ncbi:MAG: prepilin-type N-terminal cleavage/methylation domain-containing protein [Phycisphaerales bacterium]|nr:prepilin-type N-terminal cleavage/methylation domain-containing protein [Phycisphaerales bacterium]
MNPINQNLKPMRAFSLIEVLIAILVLALGLLGLGAIFPVVISQQRTAVDATQGEVVASTAMALLSGQSEIIDLNYMSGDVLFNGILIGGEVEYSYLWQSGRINAPGGFNLLIFPEYDLATGSITLGDIPAGNGNTATTDLPWIRTIPLNARLYPQAHSGVEPQFVWDFIARREPTHNAVQIGIFVRRVESRIPVPRDFSLSDVLTGNGTPKLIPVASSATGLPTIARPPPSPGVFYASPQYLGVFVDDEKLDRFEFTNPNGFNGTSREFVRKIGQKLLDNTGVVRTVVGLDKNDVNVVIVDPPFRLGNSSDGSIPLTDAQRASWVQQIVFTPKTPAAIRVFTVEGGS